MPTHYESDNDKLVSQANTLAEAAIWDMISVYADGEASPNERARVEAMLLQNSSLVMDLAFLRRTSTAVRTLTEVDPPAALRDAIYTATTRRPNLSRRMNLGWNRVLTSLVPRAARRLAVAGGACLAAGLVIALLAPRGQAPRYVARQTTRSGSHQMALVVPKVTPVASEPEIVIPAEAIIHANAPRRLVAGAATAHRTETRVSPAPRVVATDEPTAMQAQTIKHSPVIRIAMTPTEPKTVLAVVESPKPHGYDSKSNDEVEGRFSHLPMMDQANRRGQIITAADRTTSDTLGANIETNREDADKNSDAPAEDAPKRIRVVRLSQLPPDARRYLTSADIKREMDARNLGFNRSTMEGIKREEATVALIGGKF